MSLLVREWFEDEASRIVADLNPEINIHRSHRNYAFAQAAESTGSDAAFYTGYLGGELLMGIYFDDLIFTDFLKEIWKTGRHQRSALQVGRPLLQE